MMKYVALPGWSSIKGIALLRLLFIIVSLALFIEAALIIQVNHKLVRTAQGAEGTVTGLATYGLQPEVQFAIPGGAVVSFRQPNFVFGYSVNQKVPVIYNPSQITQASIDGFRALWLPPLALIAFAFVLFFLSREKTG